MRLEKCIFEEYERLRTSLGVVFALVPISPNIWTMLAFLCGLVGFVVLAHVNIQIGLLFFLLSAVFDIIDGGVAAVRKGETPFGAWFDDISDRSRELLLFLSLFIAPITWACPYVSKELSIVLLTVLSMFVDFIKMHAGHRKILKESDVAGFAKIERTERFAIVLVGLIMYNFEQSALAYAVLIALLLSAFRVVQVLHFVLLKGIEKFKHVRKIREVI